MYFKNVKFWPVKDQSMWLVALRIMFGLEWLIAGWEKIMDPAYLTGFSKTLAFFVSKNTHTWYVDFINNFVLPNQAIFAHLVSWGELLVGIALISGLFTSIGLIAGIFMNLNFYFATGWIGPANVGLNLIMVGTQVILLLSTGAEKLSLGVCLYKKVQGKILTLSKNTV